MAKPKHIILTEEGVITQEALLAYAQGRLSPEEVAQMDRLLREDPFAQEALDGIRTSTAAAGMDTAVTAINSRLREKAGMREKKRKGIEIHWATYAYAAMIAGVLIGLGFVMVHFMQQHDTTIAMSRTTPQAEESVPVAEPKAEAPATVADTTQPATETVSPATPDTVKVPDQHLESLSAPTGVAIAPVAPHNPAPAIASQAKAAPATSANNSSPAAERKAVPVQADQVVAKPTAPPTAEADKKNTAARINSNTADKDAGKVSPTPQTKAEAKKEKAIAIAADQMKEARTLFDAGDFKEAAKKYDKVLSDQPDNMDALFFGGICEYKNGKLRPAEKNFDKLIKSGQYIDGSKWYKANVLLERGKKDEARQLLKELSTTPNPYKDRAVKKYEEVQK